MSDKREEMEEKQAKTKENASVTLCAGERTNKNK